MTRLMYDSTNTQDDPAAAHLVAYYVDGIYAVSAAAVKARFPQAILVPISAVGTDTGIVGDVEPGCIALGSCVEWVKLRRLANTDPTLYVNEMNTWAPARAAFQAAGIPEPHWWVADYDGIPVIPAGAIAKQYANPTLTHGHFDLSVVADYWPGVDGHEEPDMDVTDPNFQALIYRVAVSVGAIKPADVPADHQAYVAGVVPLADIEAQIAALPSKIVVPAPVIDTTALADAIVARMPQPNKPPVAPQAVKDWWAQLTHWLGLS